MFENPGTKIKKISIVLFWLSIIVIAILGFFGMVSMNNGYDMLRALGLLIFGPIICYISTLYIVAFGELVENTAAIKEQRRQIIIEKTKT